MLRHTAVVLLWELAVGLALLGCGWTVLRLLRLPERSVAAAGITGVAAFLFLGGLANGAHLLGATPMYVFVACGLACLLAMLPHLLSRRPFTSTPMPSRPSLPGWLPLALGCALLGALLVGNLTSRVWNTDDLDGYLPIAIKTAQTGSLQPDPFSERRLTTGLGGGSILDALMLAPRDLRTLHFIDGVFGLFLFAAATWAVSRRWGLSPVGAGVLLCLVPLLPMLQINLTIVYLSAGGFLVLALLLSETQTLGSELLVALIAAGVCCTKSTNIPYTVLLLSCMLLVRRAFDRTAPLARPLAVITICAVLFLAPLSLAQHRTEGTFLYPLLGRGFHESAYGVLPSPAQLGTRAFVITTAAPVSCLLFLATLFTWRATRAVSPSRRGVALGFLLATALTPPIIAFSTGGEAFDRYTAPFVVPATLLFFVVLGLSVRRASAASPAVRLAGMALAFSFLVYLAGFIGWDEDWYHPTVVALTNRTSHRPPLRDYERLVPSSQWQSWSAQMAQAEAALPPGASVLEVLRSPAQLNFRRNNIYIMDHPGMAGPAAVPLDGGPGALGAYLQRQGVPFVLFDYASYPDPASGWPDFKAKPSNLPGLSFFLRHPNKAHSLQTWGRMENAVSSETYLNLFKLSRTKPHLYDDGAVVVFRLN